MFHVKHCVPALEGRFASTAGGRRRIIAVPAHAGDDREAADRLFPIASAMFHVKHSYGLPVRRMQGGALEGSRGGRGRTAKAAGRAAADCEDREEPQDARRQAAKVLGSCGVRRWGPQEVARRAAMDRGRPQGARRRVVGRAAVGRGRAWGARGWAVGGRGARAGVFAGCERCGRKGPFSPTLAL